MRQSAQQARLVATAAAVAGAAHDLANLLAAMCARAQAALASAELPPDARSEILALQTQAGQAACLVRRLLAEPESLELMPVRVPVDLAPLLSGLAEDLRAALGPERHLLVPTGGPDHVVSADPGALGHVLLELVRNAGAAMPVGGALALSVATETIPRPRPAVPDPLGAGTYAVIAVHDDGAGFPPSLGERAFDLFVTSKLPGEGTGLGLAEARRRLRAMGATLTLHETGPRGTELRLYFPLLENTRAGTVLLVEDEPALRRAAARALEKDGWRVIAADSAEDALDRLANERASPTILITDLALPGMDGLDLLRELRRRTPSLPVIVTSGYAGVPPEADVVMLRKPYPLAALLASAAQARAWGPGKNPGSSV